MKRRVRARHLISMMGLLSGLGVCADACLPRGQIMLIVNIDGEPGSDVHEIRILVDKKQRATVDLRKDAAGRLPATLGIVPHAPDDEIVVEVIAQGPGKEQRKTMAMTAPPYGIQNVFLSLPFLCDEDRSICQDDEVCDNDGRCRTNEAALAQAAPSEQTPEGISADPSCFDVLKCFDGVSSFVPVVWAQSSCALAVSTQDVNVALLTALDVTTNSPPRKVLKGAGFCGSALCYVPLDDTAVAPGGLLPLHVCDLINSGELLGVVTSPVTATCPKKVVETIVSGPWSDECSIGSPSSFVPQWESKLDLVDSPYLSAAAKLGDGRVMLTGGATSTNGLPGAATGDGWIVDPLDAQHPGSNIHMPARAAHTITPFLLDGDEVVLVAGGTSSLTKLDPLATFDLYIPGSGEKLAVGDKTMTARYLHSATRIPGIDAGEEDTVLVTGGGTTDGSALLSAERFFPSTLAFEAPYITDPMKAARLGHTATLLTNHDVLIAGGGAQFVGGTVSGVLESIEIYSDETKTFDEAGMLRHARALHSATLLGDTGLVLFAGGSGADGAPIGDVELFDPATRLSQCLPAMNVPRYLHQATHFTDGTGHRVLVTGGITSMGSNAPAELFNYDTESHTGTWDLVGVPTDMLRAGHTATKIDDRKVWIAGGAHVSITPKAVPDLQNRPSTWLFTLPELPESDATHTAHGCDGSTSTGGTGGSGGGGEPLEPPAEIDFNGSGCAATPGASRIDCHVPSAPTPTGAAPWAFLVLALAARRRRLS